MKLNKDLMGLLTQVALKKSELGSVDGLYSVRIKNEYGYFIVYIGTRKTLIKGFSQVATNENLRIELSSLDDDQTLHSGRVSIGKEFNADAVPHREVKSTHY